MKRTNYVIRNVHSHDSFLNEVGEQVTFAQCFSYIERSAANAALSGFVSRDAALGNLYSVVSTTETVDDPTNSHKTRGAAPEGK